MPVFNGESSIEEAIKSILSQSYRNIELIISDNNSNDSTRKICKKFKDKRIRYFRQKKNIGIGNNFIYVLKKANGSFFMWQAADDYRGADFIEHNLYFLLKNKDYVGSTSPVYFDKKTQQYTKKRFHSLDGELYERLVSFINLSYDSHRFTYSLFKKKFLFNCEALKTNNVIHAGDWLMIAHLLIQGKLKTIKKSKIVFGLNGISTKKNAHRIFRKDLIEFFLPYYKFSLFIIKKFNYFSFFQKFVIFFHLIKLNLHGLYVDFVRSNAYNFFKHFFFRKKS